MFSDDSRLNVLQSRKRLLIAESELNRAQLVHEAKAIAGDVRLLSSNFGTIGSLVSAAASLLAALISSRRKPAEPAREPFSWWQTLIKGAGLAGSIWSRYGSQRRGPKEEGDRVG
jgi:hypothetical protein